MTRAATAPSAVSLLGMMRWSRSISVIGTSTSTKASPSQASWSAPLATTTSASSAAVVSSTSGNGRADRGAGPVSASPRGSR